MSELFKDADAKIVALAQQIRDTDLRVAEAMAEGDKEFESIGQSISALNNRLNAVEELLAVQPEPEEPPVPEPEIPYMILPAVLHFHGDTLRLSWVEVEGWDCNVEIGTEKGTDGKRNNIFWQPDPIKGGQHIQSDLPPNNDDVWVRFWYGREGTAPTFIDYKFIRSGATIPETPVTTGYSQWPLDAETCDFRHKYNDLEGFHLMKQGLSYIDNFRYIFGHEGRMVEVANQHEFDSARSNGDIGIIKWTPSTAAVLIDKRRDHDSVQLFICETLSFIRTWGNIAIDCKKVSKPSTGNYNIVAHGGNVLKSLPAGLDIHDNSWGDIAIEPPSDKLFGNIITQGGVDFNYYKAGREFVEFARGAWQSNWSNFWDKGMKRPFPMNTENTGVQGQVMINLAADGDQTVGMPSWLDPAKSNHPHGRIIHRDVFMSGVIAGSTPEARWTRPAENMSDQKTAIGILIEHCLATGFVQNDMGDNGSSGTGALGTHFWCNDALVTKSVSHNQRFVEFGCGDKNMVRECFAGDPERFAAEAVAQGLKSKGAWDIVAYLEKRYDWLELGKITAVSSRDNVFDHTPHHGMNDGVELDSQGDLVVDSNMNVVADFGPLGKQAIGTTDPKAKGSIWYAG